MHKIQIMDHPLIQHKINYIRREEVGSKEFREIVGEIASLMCYEASRDLKLQDVRIKTPICEMTGKELSGKKLETFEPFEYYCKLPADCEEREVFVVDPMLATGGSSAAAIRMLKDKGVKKIRFLCIIAAPEGVEKMKREHPDVALYIGALDDHLNEHKYIVPGLGDAGDRIFGTK